MKTSDRLKLAGHELVRGNLGNAVKSLTSNTPLIPSTYQRGMWMFNQDGSPDIHYQYVNFNSSIKGYVACPPIAAIINRKASAYINGKTWILNTEGKEKGKEATSAEALKLRKLLLKPNPIQSWRQFEAQNYIYQQISGFCVVLPIKPIGFKSNIDATSMWNIPPWMLEIEQKPQINLAAVVDIKDFIQSIHIVCNGQKVPLNLDDVFIFRDQTPSADSMILPESRMKALEQPINNIIGAFESRGVLIDKRGPSYVISSNQTDDSGRIALSPAERDELEKEFQKYGLRRKQIQAIITSANINLHTVGFTTKDLMLFEEIEDDVMRICDTYNYPHRLLSSQKSNSLGGADVQAYKALLYQDAIIPESTDTYEQWSKFFDLPRYKLVLEKDYSHIAALQGDKVKEATARFQLNQALKIEYEQGLITMDEWRAKLGEDPLPNGLGTARATDPKVSNAPLATIIGVGGVQSLIQVLTARGMSPEGRQATIEIVFGISTEDARRMSVGGEVPPNNSTSNENQNT